jgi:hypothetical protein
MVIQMKKYNKNESNQKRPIMGQINISESEIDFSTYNAGFSHILCSSQPELKIIAKQMFSRDRALFERIIINIILFELEFMIRESSVILQVRSPLPMPTVHRTTPAIVNAKRVTFHHREDLGLMYRGIKEFKDDNEEQGTLPMNEIIKELEINPDTLNSLFALVKQSKSLLRAISSAIVANFSQDSYPYTKALTDPTGIITDFIHIHGKNMFITFHPLLLGKLDLITIQVKKNQ